MMPDQAKKIIGSMDMLIDRVSELNDRLCASLDLQSRIDQKLIDHIENHKWHDTHQDNICRSKHLSLILKIAVPILAILIGLSGYFIDRWMSNQELKDKELQKGAYYDRTDERYNYNQSVRAAGQSSRKPSGY
jgi:hypothetical protein